MQVCARMEYQLLVFGSCYRSLSLFTKPIKENQGSSTRGDSSRDTHQTSTPKTKPRFHPECRRTRSFLDSVRCCTSFREPCDMYPEATELILIGCLTELIWSPRFKSSVSTPKLADILTEGNFTPDAGKNLLHLFGISHFSSACCTNNFSLVSCSTMAKKIPDQKEEGVVSKSRPAVMCWQLALRLVSSRLVHQIQRILVPVLCCMFLRTMR